MVGLSTDVAVRRVEPHPVRSLGHVTESGGRNPAWDVERASAQGESVSFYDW